MDPIIVAAGINAASSLIGGELGRRSQKDANSANEALQREFAQYGIRWRVADAEAAGLHPLYALGGSGATYTPSAQALNYGDIADAGQDISRAVRASLTPAELTKQDLELEEIRSRINENDARANYFLSEAARNRSPAPVPISMGTPTPSDAKPRELRLPPGSMVTSGTEKAQTVQDEYGDIVENVYGAGRLLNDLGMNFWDAVKKQNPWWLRELNKSRERSRSYIGEGVRMKKHRFGSPGPFPR